MYDALHHQSYVVFAGCAIASMQLVRTRLLTCQSRKICHRYEAELELFALIRAISYAATYCGDGFCLKIIRRRNCKCPAGQTYPTYSDKNRW